MIIVWKKYFGQTMLPLIPQSIVPFDMGCNAIPGNGAESHDTQAYC
jgi:hypothetical protein